MLEKCLEKYNSIQNLRKKKLNLKEKHCLFCKNTLLVITQNVKTTKRVIFFYSHKKFFNLK